MKTMTAQALFNDLRQLPAVEREAFFLLVGQQAFRNENFSHDEVFGDLADAEFTASEAAEYLEVSMATFRRFVRDGKLTPHAEVGRSQLFAVAALKAFKRQRKAIKG
ncbi:helix-turn-helix domain-containing protein [Cupriavidus pauculus]|uniref:DNA-binding protein n=1 Tax=Cupriavidus pauculus TaxID=82633 RepID=A0A2N5CI53_9BURK|nr:helix-turn-helix domain-containing protein [Cupriavidus pauculus]PLQ01893.1 DNA-binding protein [Cupriavidus pauculus]